MATDTTAMDLDSRRNCSTCKTRMSSLMHDSHLMCSNCRGRDCNMDIRCVECEGWSEEAMLKYIKYRKSLDSKNKSKKDKKISASADQASLPSSRDSNVSQASVASAGISEARVAELISMQLGEFSSSFAATMQASFDNIKTFIDDRFAQETQLEPNPSLSDSSPVPVDLGPRQAQTDPSMCNPCIAFGAGGQAQEPVQEVTATSSFLAFLLAAGFAVPQGVVIGDRVGRDVSPATVHDAPAVAVQYEQPQEPLRGGRPPQAAAAHLAPARRGQDAQPQSVLRTSREPQAHGVLPGPALGESPHEIAFRKVNFAERVREFAEEDESFSSMEKVVVSEGHRNALHLLYQLCPGAAPKSQPAPRKACDFEGLYALSDTALVAEGSPTLFHQVAELREEHQARFRAAAEAGKAVSSALPSRHRDRGCCSDPAIESWTPMNPSIPQLVGALSSRRSLNSSFEEAARVESLCNGLLAAQSSGFWFFLALLHWLKELGFEAPDPSLFGQLVQKVSGSLVTASNSASGLAAFMLAKRREGVLSHFPSHVGPHFKKDLAAASFNGPHVFDDEMLARVIAASREVSHLDAQLSIAKAFTLPVFRAEAKNTGRKASSGQGSSASSASTSGFRGRGRGLDSEGSKRKASSPGRYRNKKSPPWLFPCF